MARLWRIFGVVLVISSYFAAAPFGYAAFAVLRWIPTRDPEGRARRLQGILTFAFGFMHAVLRWLRIVDFDPRQMEGAIPEGPCVIVANHPTLMDVSALFAAERNLATAIKPAIYRAFWARPLLEQAAQFEGSTDDPLSTRRVIEDAIDRLERGYRVLLFPEGTRSPPEGIRPFGRTAFEVAARAQVPVVPIVIECRPRWLSKEHRFLDPPRAIPKMRLRVLSPIAPPSAGGCSRAFRDMVTRAIRKELDGTKE